MVAKLGERSADDVAASVASNLPARLSAVIGGGPMRLFLRPSTTNTSCLQDHYVLFTVQISLLGVGFGD